MAIGHDYEIDYYVKENGECPVKEMLDAMPPKHAAKIMKFFELLEEKGPNLPRPYADALRGKIGSSGITVHDYKYGTD